ncbi:S8 family peptidase [Rossellomorea oryzaecorticis]|uniref:S8 family peptidase n=1 Tax=Rossellomorea oryzaecorticis TaxID=1396505 RepID=A0ABW8VLN7_9BACI
MKKIIAVLSLLLLYIPLIVHAETSDREYIVTFIEDIDWNALHTAKVEVLDSYEVISAVSVKASESEAAVLNDSPRVSTIQESKTYEIRDQQISKSFPMLNITPDIQTVYRGTGVKIGILDTGVDLKHPDLKVNGGICVLEESCTRGYQDDNGHGTHVAGVIGALDNEIGVVGVVPDAGLYAIKAMDSTGTGTTATILAGVEWAIENKMDILNMSVTTDQDDPALKQMIDRAYNEGMLIVGAAGNNGTKSGDGDTVLYPARYSSVIAVGAVNDNQVRVASSATGNSLEFVAPGYNIYSTVPLAGDSFDGIRDGYTYMTGTSMAAPYITGIIAAYKEQFPSSTPQQIRDILGSNVKDLGAAGRDPLYGKGLAQAAMLPVPEGNAVQAKVDNGKVTFTINKSEEVEYVEIVSSKGEKSVIEDNIKIEYVLAGTHKYYFKYHFKDGRTYSVPVSVEVKKPIFTDLSSTQWFSPHMVYLNYHGILKGYKDGGVHPYESITRGEALALVGRAIGLDGEQRSSYFKDVESSYFASGYIQSAFDQTIIKGFSDQTFRPGQNVTRAEMAILIAKAFNLKSNKEVVFSDVGKSISGYSEIAALIDSSITRGFSDGTFRPYQPITRSEFAVFLARAKNADFK